MSMKQYYPDLLCACGCGGANRDKISHMEEYEKSKKEQTCL